MQISPPHRGWQWREADGWYAETHIRTRFHVKTRWNTDKICIIKVSVCAAFWVMLFLPSPPCGSGDVVPGINRAFHFNGIAVVA